MSESDGMDFFTEVLFGFYGIGRQIRMKAGGDMSTVAALGFLVLTALCVRKIWSDSGSRNE